MTTKEGKKKKNCGTSESDLYTINWRGSQIQNRKSKRKKTRRKKRRGKRRKKEEEGEVLNYISVAVTKDHDQSNIYKRVFNWVYISRRLESMIAQWRHGDRNSWSWSGGRLLGLRTSLSCYHTSWHTPFNKVIPNPCQQTHKLRTNYLNTLVYEGGILIQTITWEALQRKRREKGRGEEKEGQKRTRKRRRNIKHLRRPLKSTWIQQQPLRHIGLHSHLEWPKLLI